MAVACDALVIGSRVLFGAILAAVAAGLLAVAARPEIWAAGTGFVVTSTLAVAGTQALALLLAAALAGGFLLHQSLAESGRLAALSSLGYGPGSLLRAMAPLLVGGALVAVVAAFWVEPTAWTAIHAVRGSPAVTAAALGRLDAGEVIALGDGAASRSVHGLEVAVPGAAATMVRAAPSAGGWLIQELAVEGEIARWSAGSLRLRPLVEPSPPTSPLTFGWARGRLALRDADGGADRARLVFHRRHALVLLAPLLVLGGFLLAARRRGADPGRPLVRVGVLGIVLFLLVRVSDQGALAGALNPVVAAWVPLAAAPLGVWILRGLR